MARRSVGEGRESGAALVEFAFVAMLLFVLAAGAFDYGMAWRTGLAINEASRTGARVGSAMGDQPTTDYYLLSGSKAALESSGKLGEIERVVIFRSANADGVVPEQCKVAMATSQPCVIIEGDVFRSGWDIDDFNAGPGQNGCFELALVSNWCPGDRESQQLIADYIGIWVKYRQDHFFSVTGGHVMVERQSVMRLEPRVENGT